MHNTHTTADQVLVRRLNTALILEHLRKAGRLSRAALSASTGLNRSTVSSIISELLEASLVRETDEQASTGGRPGLLVEINPAGGAAIGVELGVDVLSVILTDFVAGVLWRERIASDPTEAQAVILERVESLVQQAIDLAANEGLKLRGIGLGVPGLVDLHEGRLIFAPNLHWHDVPLRARWMQKFAVPVFVENEANAAALGEYYFGNTHTAHHLIYLSANVGLGGGIIIDGRLFRGKGGYGGEIGHMMIDPQGELCGCGKRGCWETLVGPQAMVQRIQLAIHNGAHTTIPALAGGDLSTLTNSTAIKALATAALTGDAVALDALDYVAHHLGIGIANLINIFNPELIILGGALNLLSRFLLPRIEATVSKNALASPRAEVQIVPSAHGVDACAMGAVALVLDDVLREPEFRTSL